MDRQNIRIRLKAFDHRILDTSTKEIVSTAVLTISLVEVSKMRWSNAFNRMRMF